MPRALLARDPLEQALEAVHALAHAAPVEVDAALALAACADTREARAPDARHAVLTDGEARQLVAHARERDAQLGRACARSALEDAQHELGAPEDFETGPVFEIALLHTAELMIEDEVARRVLDREARDLVDLARADEGPRVGALALLEAVRDDIKADRTHELEELGHALLRLVEIALVHTDEERAFGVRILELVQAERASRDLLFERRDLRDVLTRERRQTLGRALGDDALRVLGHQALGVQVRVKDPEDFPDLVDHDADVGIEALAHEVRAILVADRARTTHLGAHEAGAAQATGLRRGAELGQLDAVRVADEDALHVPGAVDDSADIATELPRAFAELAREVDADKATPVAAPVRQAIERLQLARFEALGLAGDTGHDGIAGGVVRDRQAW